MREAVLPYNNFRKCCTAISRLASPEFPQPSFPVHFHWDGKPSPDRRRIPGIVASSLMYCYCHAGSSLVTIEHSWIFMLNIQIS
jgi:hypothetical protein